MGSETSRDDAGQAIASREAFGRLVERLFFAYSAGMAMLEKHAAAQECSADEFEVEAAECTFTNPADGLDYRLSLALASVGEREN